MRLLNWLLCGLMTTALWAAPVRAASLPDSAALLAPNIQFMLSVDNVRHLRDQLEKTNLYALYHDPAMRPFSEHLQTQLDQWVQQQDDALLRQLVKMDNLPEGRVLVAGRLPTDTAAWDAEPSFVVLAQWGQSAQEMHTAIEQLLQKQLDGDTHRTTERYRGYDIVTHISPRRNLYQDQEAEPTRMHYCFFEDITVLSNDVDMLQFALGQIDGARSRTLADDADYQRARRAIGTGAHGEFYINLNALIESMFLGGPEEFQAEMRQHLTAFGLDGLSGVSAGLTLAPEPGTNAAVTMFLPTSSPRRGILKMVELPPRPFRLPPFVDPQAGQVGFINVDFPSAAAELFEMLAAINPMYAAALNNPMTPPQADGSPGIIPKDDLLDNLGEQIIYFSSVQADPDEAMGIREEQVYAIAVRDAQSLSRAVAGLHTQFFAVGNPDLQREFLGYTLYVLPLESLFMPGLDPAQTRQTAMALAVTETHLLIGQQIALEKALQRLAEPTQTQPLAEAAWYRSAMAHMPSDAGMISMDNNRLLGKAYWNALREGKLFEPLMTEVPDEAFNIVLPALKKLPDFDAVRQHFGITLNWLRTRPDGFLLEAKDIPAPPVRP